MLKRHQVLLDDWQEVFIRNSAENFDFSFSEVIRILIADAILNLMFSLKPKNNLGITYNDLTELKKKVLDPKTSVEERHKIISKVYFEGRKAAEEGIRTQARLD